MLLLILISSVLCADSAEFHGAVEAIPPMPGTATPTFPPHHDHDDPNKCVDIHCYEPITWSDNKKEVCRFRKEKECKQKTETKCVPVPETWCKLVGYTECDWTKTPMPARDDKVVGEYFNEKKCTKGPIEIIEKKTEPMCINMTKPVCKKKWIPDPPFWIEVDCQDLTWLNCTLVDKDHPVTLPGYCNCTTETEIWYNKLERVDSICEKEATTCVPKAVPVCETKTVEKCIPVTWEECTETCVPDCEMMHFKEPSQQPKHTRWCSHVEIEVPSWVTRPPPTEGRKLMSKRSAGSTFSKTKSTTLSSNVKTSNSPTSSSSGNFRIVPSNPDSPSSPLVSRKGPPVRSRRSSQAPQNSRQPIWV